ncbi:OmpA family protein [Paracoccus sp. p4-l81]|uniref:OmpA family protein n=1 Tax=unclassified Paracoccus (in: a-proteobacteria) TaxID=2688777 RepID=UPI0035B8D213
MRKLIGYLVLVLGVLGLGLWARGEHAPRIEKHLDEAAKAVAGTSIHGAQTRVSGRDITIGGLADSAAERDRLLADLDALHGRRVVNDDLRILEPAAPYTFGVDKTADGGLANVAGVIPSEAARARLAGLIGAEAAKGLELASGAPDGNWTGAIGAGLGALAALDSGSLSLVDQVLTITGTASGPDAAAKAETALAALPAGYTAKPQIEVPVPAMPGDWSLSWTETDGAKAAGQLPAGLDLPALAVALGLPSVAGDAAPVQASDPTEAATGQAALSALAAKLDDLSAFDLRMQGLTAAATVTAKPGADVDAIRQALAGALPQGADISVAATLPEADYRLDYVAGEGATIAGAAPEGLDAAAVAGALGLNTVSADLTPAKGGADLRDAGLAAIGAFKAWLPQIEKLGLSLGAKPAASVELTAGADAELIGAALSEGLGTGVALDVSAPALRVADGAERLNAATGETERFVGGFWLPKRDFTADVAACNGMAQDILDRFGIGYVTGSARLNAEAARAVNELAAIMAPCAAAGLKAELGGHTDATGDAEVNRKLSQDRAQSVFDALVARGVPAAAMTAMGFGASQPIADNATEEGRAKNRRTTIVWTN